MFEQLAGKVLWNVLSKYFTDESLSKNKVSKSAQLGIWSGFVALQELEVRRDVINTKLRGKGHPIELVQCVIRRVEITIPWAKLSSPIGNRRSSDSNDDDSSNNNTNNDEEDDSVAAILVLDGVHVLFCTNFEFHDEELRSEEVRKRREALARSKRFAVSGKVDAYEDEEDGTKTATSSNHRRSYADMLKERITSGVLQQVVDKLHVHIRDLHVRVEDIQQSDPWAFGLTLESMHILHDTDQERSSISGVVSKIAQINHFSAYWNALEYSNDVPVENSILHITLRNRPGTISRSLDKCIARRGSVVASQSRQHYVPLHSYILLPLDGTMHFYLSMTPKDLRLRPALEVVVNVDVVSTQLRDFQCVQMLRVYGRRKNFKFMQKYRRFRPTVSIMENPKAWWLYAASVVKYQLEESYLRWSWTRFRQVYAARLRYIELYERRIRGAKVNGEGEESAGGTSNRPSTSNEMSLDEEAELQRLEDGVEGGLSVSDIALFRALVHMRLGRIQPTSLDQQSKRESSWYGRVLEDVTTDDRDAREEFDRLVQYLENLPSDRPFSESRNESLTFLSMEMNLEEVRMALFAPLPSTFDEPQRRRLHEKFIESYVAKTAIAMFVKGDYNRWGVDFSVEDFVASEIRLDRSKHVIANPMKSDPSSQEGSPGEAVHDGKRPLLMFSYAKKPIENPDIEKELNLFLSRTEWKLNLDCQWITRAKEFIKIIAMVPNVSKFWGELSLVHLNSLALGQLGLVAKAESAASKHENLFVDIHVFCPVVRIGMGDGCDLIFDFGVLALQTDRLAGVSRNKINHLPLLQDDEGTDETNQTESDQYWSTGFDDASLALGGSFSGRTRSSRTPTNSIRTSARRLMYGSGASSTDSFRQLDNGNGSVAGGSFFVDDEFSRTETRTDPRMIEEPTSQSLFYDTYKMQLQTGKVIFSGESEVSDISSGIEIHGTIQTSILPSDHTICRMKAHMVVGSLNLILTEDMITRIALASAMWRTLIRNDVGSQNFQWASSTLVDMHKELDFNQTVSLDISSHLVPDAEMSGSEVDDEDFFDAIEGVESLGGENSGIWFEDNWIADAESVIDGESSRSSIGDRRGRRRQPSISDVSSTSDQSRSRRNQHENGYLSAENLARLEENAGEDDSVADSRIEKDDDSFHSVLTDTGQVKLIQDLEANIEQSKEQMNKLRDAERELSLSNGVMAEAELRNRRQRRKAMKLELCRSEAELKAMRVLMKDLRLLMSYEGGISGTATSTVERLQHAKDATALLKARKQRFATDGDTNAHNLTQGLNRQKFKGSILFDHVRLSVQVGGKKDSHDTTPETVFDFQVKQIASAVILHENDTRLYISLDQATACIETPTEGQHDGMCILFSGGSSDTLLPVHLPHLIAQSMEDRFVRGALRLRKLASAGQSTDIVTVLKLRLVVGDIEVSPYHKCIAPLAYCLKNLLETPSKKSSRTNHDEGPDDRINTMSTPSSRLEKARSFDVAVRLPSIRVSLSRSNSVVGALTISEASIRVLQRSSTKKIASHVDIRCSNVQLLDINNLEGGRGLEVFGRRDPYSNLVQLRMRHQLLPVSEEARWVLGIDKRSSERADLMSAKSAHKIYVSGRINPVSVVASSDTARKIVDSIQELKQGFGRARDVTNEKQEKTDVPNQEKSGFSKPLQWRVDISIRRVHAVFQEYSEEKKDWGHSDDMGNKMSMAFTVTLSATDTTQFADHCMFVQLGLTDVSMLRYADDWPILEPCSCLLRVSLGQQNQGSHEMQPLLVSGAEIDSVMTRFGWDANAFVNHSDDTTSVSFKISPLKLNISAPTVQLLSDTVKSFQTPKGELKRDSQQDRFLSSSSASTSMPFALQVSMEEVEIQLLHEEAGTRPISHANALLLFTLADATIDYTRASSVTASVLIRKSDLFDLSSGRGIRVIGEEPGARLDVPYFVQVKAYTEHHLDGPQTARVTINWGCIQCLALPSFVQSIIDFKDSLSISDIQRKKSLGGKKDLFSRLLNHPNDVNIMLNAECETFECILPSQDMTKLVKDGVTDPIGVVSFRWRASLAIAFGLDCLRPGSMPWLTLNLDGNFTDDDGANLLKSFSHRYLDGGKPGLHNVFTIRLSHNLLGFQALRTNITQIELPFPMKYGYNPLPRVCFTVTQPLAGEQRITNPIDFAVLYRSAGASSLTNHVEMSQSLSFNAKFVDVLVYIQSRSSGGFTDAVRVSVKPILEKFKRKDKLRVLDRKDSLNPAFNETDFKQTQGLLEMGKTSPIVIAISIDGFQVTCVPGGASSLNESPIIKFELSKVSAGIAAAPMRSQNLYNVPSNGTLEDLSPRHDGSGTEMKSIFVGAWVRCQLSGHYHNRRLVGWEPFLEPWTATLQFGMDLVDFVSWLPVIKHETKLERPVRMEQIQSAASLTQEVQSEVSENGKTDRLRDLGRLLRSPFQSSASPGERMRESSLIAFSDFCYLLLASTTSITFASATFPSRAQQDINGRLFSILPTQDGLGWLKEFGMPNKQAIHDADETLSVSFLLSDSRPLNVNLTGALLENISGYISSSAKKNGSKVVPHLIRNDSGMVGHVVA
jgi:Vacuolar sorting-associated protein 13, N-terminal/N-terminal region of Chorein or VPS13